MPLADNYEAINVSGIITALSVNMNTRIAASFTDKNSNKINQVEKVYKIVVELETTDEKAIQHLTMIRMRQNGTKTADLIIWPLA